MKHKSLTINEQLEKIVSELTQFIDDNDVNVSKVAQDIGYPRKRIGEVLAGKRYDLDIVDNLLAYLKNCELSISSVPRKYSTCS